MRKVTVGWMEEEFKTRLCQRWLGEVVDFREVAYKQPWSPLVCIKVLGNGSSREGSVSPMVLFGLDRHCAFRGSGWSSQTVRLHLWGQSSVFPRLREGLGLAPVQRNL